MSGELSAYDVGSELVNECASHSLGAALPVRLLLEDGTALPVVGVEFEAGGLEVDEEDDVSGNGLAGGTVDVVWIRVEGRAAEPVQDAAADADVAVVLADVYAVRAWAAEWPTARGVLLHRSGTAVNVLHVDPDREDEILDHLHQEPISGQLAEASRRLTAAASQVVEMGAGYRDGHIGCLVIDIPEKEATA